MLQVAALYSVMRAAPPIVAFRAPLVRMDSEVDPNVHFPPFVAEQQERTLPNHEQAEAIPGTGGKGLQIGTPIVGLAQGKGLNVGVSQHQASTVGGVAGIQHQSCISGIQHRKRQVCRPLLRTDEQLNLTVRINGDIETTAAPLGHG